MEQIFFSSKNVFKFNIGFKNITLDGYSLQNELLIAYWNMVCWLNLKKLWHFSSVLICSLIVYIGRYNSFYLHTFIDIIISNAFGDNLFFFYILKCKKGRASI